MAVSLPASEELTDARLQPRQAGLQFELDIDA
jgi:hypothetical protein